MDETGRLCRASVSGGSRVREIQPVGRLRHRQIKIKTLPEHFFTGGRAQSGASLLQTASVRLGKNALLHRRFRNQSVIDPGKKEHADFSKPRPLDIADHDLILARRNDADRDLLKSSVENLLIFLHGHPLISEHDGNPVQQVHNGPVELRIFLCSCRVARPGKTIAHLLQPVLKPMAHNQAVQHLCPVFRRHLPPVKSLMKFPHLTGKFFTQPVVAENRGFSTLILRIGAARTALRHPRPLFVIFFPSAHAERAHIGFHIVGFLS